MLVSVNLVPVWYIPDSKQSGILSFSLKTDPCGIDWIIPIATLNLLDDINLIEHDNTTLAPPFFIASNWLVVSDDNLDEGGSIKRNYALFFRSD